MAYSLSGVYTHQCALCSRPEHSLTITKPDHYTAWPFLSSFYNGNKSFAISIDREACHMEALGVAASIITVLEVAKAVISICCDYSAAVKGVPWELPKVTQQVRSLRNVLELLEALAKRAEVEDLSADTRLPALIQMCKSDVGPLAMCKDDLKFLNKKLSRSSKRTALVQALTWPLKEAETKKILQNIERNKTTLVNALGIDQTAMTFEIHEMSRTIQAEMSGISEGVARLDSSFSMVKLDAKLDRWLSAPDPSSNHNEACAKRQATTGDWFIESSEFTKWKKDKNSFLWLHGIPGCGKTILCSTVIENVLLQSPPAVKKAVAYFYFEFRDTGPQHGPMIRSLVSQLAAQCTNQPNPLESLYSSCSDGARQPKLCDLRQALRDLVQNFDNTFIILDALDECGEREQLLNDMQEFAKWQLGGLHILVTSRREWEIEKALDFLVNENQKIDIQGENVARDIYVFVHQIVQTGRDLSRWRGLPEVQDEIEKVLTKKANGMFRWVVCQIDELKKCPNRVMLRKKLYSLPTTLPETYERILLNIQEDHSQYALKMLQWLTYSKQPLSLSQLAEVVAIDEDEDPRFDPERRFPEPEDALMICSSLVTTTEEDEYTLDSNSLLTKRVRVVKVKLAHFSVQEYLVSSQIMKGAAQEYSIEEIDANVRIARDCLLYMLYFTEHFPKPGPYQEDEFWSEFPLAQHAAERWTEHARVGGQINEESMVDLIMELFTSEGNAFSSPCRGKFCQDDGIEAPLYYASINDLLGVARRLITMGVDINASSGRFGTALCAASAKGNAEMVKLLLEEGADPNPPKHNGKYGSAMFWASLRGYDAIVRLLLDAGAEVGLKGSGYFRSALHSAAKGGHASIVAMLISTGMDVNLNVGQPMHDDTTALAIASKLGYVDIVKQLVEAGADLYSRYASLCSASRKGHDEIVRVLLGAGANINQGWRMANPLREAVGNARLTTVKILLDAGADVNLGGSWDKKSFGRFYPDVNLGGSWDKKSFSRFYTTNTLFARFRERRKVLDLLAAAGAEIIDAEEMMKPVEGEWDSEKKLTVSKIS